MNEIARRWLVLSGGRGRRCGQTVVGFAGATASAEPVVPANRRCYRAPRLRHTGRAGDAKRRRDRVPQAARTTRSVTPATGAAPLGISTCQASLPPRRRPFNDRPGGLGHAWPTSSRTKVRAARATEQAATSRRSNIVLPIAAGWSQVPDPNVPQTRSRWSPTGVGGKRPVLVTTRRSWSTS